MQMNKVFEHTTKRGMCFDKWSCVLLIYRRETIDKISHRGSQPLYIVPSIKKSLCVGMFMNQSEFQLPSHQIEFRDYRSTDLLFWLPSRRQFWLIRSPTLRESRTDSGFHTHFLNGKKKPSILHKTYQKENNDEFAEKPRRWDWYSQT